MSYQKAKEWAEKLNGRAIGREVTEDENKALRADGVVVVFGASDDLMELRGSIYDEVDSYEGGVVYLSETGMLDNECDNDECPHFERMKEKAATITAQWDFGDTETEGVWTYETSIPHHKFKIMEGGEVYCTGITFALADARMAVNP